MVVFEESFYLQLLVTNSGTPEQVGADIIFSQNEQSQR
jgi:hypothetical protein